MFAVSVGPQLGLRSTSIHRTQTLDTIREQCARRPCAVPLHRRTRSALCVCCAGSFTDGTTSYAAEAQAAPRALTREGTGARATHPSTKTRVVVLGSGWGAISFIKNLDPAVFGENGQYELVLVSPRNYMLYTPLLPSAMGGVVSENSIVESVRTLLPPGAVYYEARAIDIDPAARRLTCIKEYCEVCAARKSAAAFPSPHTDADHAFTLSYDLLLCSVGAVNATFGIPGVEQRCWFLRSMEDAKRLRRHINKCLEHAALPYLSKEERRRLLSFVVVGGGPTGVEVAAELWDLVEEDVARQLPQIKDAISITLIDGFDALLNSFHTEIQTYAGRVFRGHGIDLRLGCRVTAVSDGMVVVTSKEGGRDSVRYGTCIWATGITMHPLVAALKDKLGPEVQNSRRGLLVDEHLRVQGSQGTIFCLGDAAITGTTSQASLPPTAQVARQEGEYLAHLLTTNRLALVPTTTGQPDQDLVPLPQGTKPFRYTHMGSLAYLGGQKGVMDLPFKLPFLKTLHGYLGGHTWRGLETWMQVSCRTRWLVWHDWVRAALFGRNVSDI